MNATIRQNYPSTSSENVNANDSSTASYAPIYNPLPQPKIANTSSDVTKGTGPSSDSSNTVYVNTGTASAIPDQSVSGQGRMEGLSTALGSANIITETLSTNESNNRRANANGVSSSRSSHGLPSTAHDDIDWEDGYENLRGKSLEESKTVNNSDDEEDEWVLPETGGVDVDVLMSLPISIR